MGSRLHAWVALGALVLVAQPAAAQSASPGAAPVALASPAAQAPLPKLDFRLSRAAHTLRGRGLGGVSAAADDLALVTRGPRMLVQLRVSGAMDAALTQLMAAGAQIVAAAGDHVDAFVLPGDLERVAGLPMVERVETPRFAVSDAVDGADGKRPADEVETSIGEAAYHAMGITGKGVTVAIVDGGFSNAKRLINGDVIIHGDAPEEKPGEPDLDARHGTACAEIIRRIAPDAKLILIPADYPSSVVEKKIKSFEAGAASVIRRLRGATTIHMAALDAARESGAKIVSMSWGIPSMWLDGKGPLCKMVNELSTKMLMVKSAGNDAQGVVTGVFKDTNGNGYHEFERPGQPDELSENWGAEVLRYIGYKVGGVDLIWEPGADGCAKQDLDLSIDVLGRDDVGRWQVVSSHAENAAQSPDSCAPPHESQHLDPKRKIPANGSLVALRVSGRGKNLAGTRFKVVLQRGESALSPEFHTRASSMTSPADAENAFVVAAWEPKRSRMAPYSSQGPTDDGRHKPDITAPTDARTESFGSAGAVFNGTSCATPHVAGAAALLAQLHPDWSPKQLGDELKRMAKPIAGVGPDVAGAGLLYLEPPKGPAAGAKPTGLLSPAKRERPPEEAPLRIDLTCATPGAKCTLHFTRPDGWDIFEGQPVAVWGKSWRDNPRFRRVGDTQRIEVLDLKRPGIYLLWVHCHAAGSTNQAAVELTITGSDGKPYPAKHELKTGESWVPYGIKITDGQVEGELIPQADLKGRSLRGPAGAGSLQVERDAGAGFAAIAAGTELKPSDKVRLALTLTAAAHVYVVAQGDKPQVLYRSAAPLAAGTRHLIPGDAGVALPAAGGASKLLFVVAREPLADLDALAAGGAEPTLATPVFAGEPGYEDTLNLMVDPDQAAAPARLQSPVAAGVQWAVLRFPQGAR